MSNRRAWSDFAAKQIVQPVLFDAGALAECQPKRRKPGSVKRPAIKESAIQKVILEALKLHPKVARIERINVIAGRLLKANGKASRFVRSCAKGHADLEGYAVDGRVIAIEIKRPQTRNNVSEEQREYLGSIRAAGGYAGVATCVDEAFGILESVRHG